MCSEKIETSVIVMFYRKLYVAFYTSILAVTTLFIIEPIQAVDGGIMMAILVYGSFVVPAVYIYGILTSMIAEKIGSKVEKEWVTFGIHFLFGLGFIIPYYFIFDPQTIFQLSLAEMMTDSITWLGALFSIIFYFIDRLLKRKELVGCKN